MIENTGGQSLGNSLTKLIGPAVDVQAAVKALVDERVAIQQARQKTGEPGLAIYLSGLPGSGKTSIGKWVKNAYGSRFNSDLVAGQKVTVECLSHWREHSQMCSTDIEIRVIDEADAIPPAARKFLLTVIEELPAHWIIIATSNKGLKRNSAIGSRFINFHVARPKESEIVPFVKELYPILRDKEIRGIVRKCGRDMRAILKKAKLEVTKRHLRRSA